MQVYSEGNVLGGFSGNVVHSAVKVSRPEPWLLPPSISQGHS